MKRKNKEKWRRICVSLPPDMFRDYEERAEESGLSMSRLIYLRLKNKGSMILVPQEQLRHVRQLVGMFEKISTTGVLAEPDRQVLQRVVDFEVKMVDFREKTTIIHGKEVRNHG